MQRAENLLSRLKAISLRVPTFNQMFFETLTLQAVQDKTLVFRLVVEDRYCSRFGTLHPGGMASLLDACTSVSAWVCNSTDQLTLSVNLHTMFHSYPKVGDELLIKATCLDLLTDRAITSGSIEHQDKIVAVALQELFFIQQTLP